MDPRFRIADASDAPAVAHLHTTSWRENYRGMLPDEYLDGALADELAERWRQSLAEPPERGLVLLVEDTAGLQGFVAVWPDVEARDLAFLDNLHVRAEFRGRGLGRRLLAEAARRLLDRGFVSARLWVIAANTRALAFYERLGGTVGPKSIESVGGHPVEEIEVRWPDLRTLRAAASSDSGAAMR